MGWEGFPRRVGAKEAESALDMAPSCPHWSARLGWCVPRLGGGELCLCGSSSHTWLVRRAPCSRSGIPGSAHAGRASPGLSLPDYTMDKCPPAPSLGRGHQPPRLHRAPPRPRQRMALPVVAPAPAPPPTPPLTLSPALPSYSAGKAHQPLLAGDRPGGQVWRGGFGRGRGVVWPRVRWGVRDVHRAWACWCGGRICGGGLSWMEHRGTRASWHCVSSYEQVPLCLSSGVSTPASGRGCGPVSAASVETLGSGRGDPLSE